MKKKQTDPKLAKTFEQRQRAINGHWPSPEELMRALEDGDEVVRRNSAGHPNATPEVLMRALEDKDEWVRNNAVSNDNATPDVLMRALEDDYPVRLAAAGHPNATPEVLMRALEDETKDVRRMAASNKSATPEVLMRAAENGDLGVRIIAASHPNATSDLLVMMMMSKKYGYEDVQKVVASHLVDLVYVEEARQLEEAKRRMKTLEEDLLKSADDPLFPLLIQTKLAEARKFADKTGAQTQTTQV
jgi:hypothetical protein